MENWNDKMKRFLSVAKPCPFCNSTKLDISEKTNGHICIYCRSCLTYGPRVLEYELFEDYKNSRINVHYFKTLKDMRNNSDGNKYHPIYVKKDDSEVNHDWYYEESVRRWNKRTDVNIHKENFEFV